MPEMPVPSKQSYTGRRLTLILCNTNLAKKLVSKFEKENNLKSRPFFLKDQLQPPQNQSKTPPLTLLV